MSTPQNLGDPLKRGLMERLVDELNVAGVCMVQQALLSLYSYNTTSGIIVDIGHRIEILPIYDGRGISIFFMPSQILLFTTAISVNL